MTENLMKDMLIILSPPRSFSSVVSTMIGEHPDLYCFPELHLFMGDTVLEVIERERKKVKFRYSGPDGLLRTLAQLHDGIQTTGSIVKAAAWLHERSDWSIKKLMDYLLEKVYPQIGVEKSPVTALKTLYLERAYALYPNAYFLHLIRHPVSARKSMVEFDESRRSRMNKPDREIMVERLIAWYTMHKNIIGFTNSLPLGQCMRVKGEDVLSEPDVYLRQIAEWLDIRTDKEAIDTMQHPENSHYAYVGPELARGGNDTKFMQSPSLRHGRVREPSLADFLAKENPKWFNADFLELIHDAKLELVTDKEITEEIVNFSQCMGYQ